MTYHRHLPLAALMAGFVLANGCGRTGLDRLTSVSSTDGGAGGTGQGGSAGTTTPTDGAGGTVSGPCPEAPCLTPLFLACMPEGSCSVQGGSSPSASFRSACYANGVTVHSSGAYNGSGVTWARTVMRNGSRCYTLDGSEYGSTIAHVFSDSNGSQVATGITNHDTGSFTVTCNGGKSITVNPACMNPTGDGSACASGSCP
jgi:hypothetical protein